jgi:hypothetical protein
VQQPVFTWQQSLSITFHCRTINRIQQNVEPLNRKITAHGELVVCIRRIVGTPMLETKIMYQYIVVNSTAILLEYCVWSLYIVGPLYRVDVIRYAVTWKRVTKIESVNSDWVHGTMKFRHRNRIPFKKELKDQLQSAQHNTYSVHLQTFACFGSSLYHSRAKYMKHKR